MPDEVPCRTDLLGDPVAFADSLAGRWDGSYFYPDDQPAGAFHLTLEPGGKGTFSGRTREPNSFSEALVATLDAVVDGHVDADGAVFFTKRYDGTGGVSHSVDYVGRLAPDGLSLFGQWRIDEYAGPFVVQLAAPARGLPMMVREPRSALTGDWTGASTGPGDDDPPAHLTVELEQHQGTIRGDAVEDDGSARLHLEVSGRVTAKGRVRLAFCPPGEVSQVDCNGWLAPNERALGGWWQQGDQRGLWHLIRAAR